MQPVISQDDLRVLRQVHGPEGDGLDMSSNDQTRFNLSIDMCQAMDLSTQRKDEGDEETSLEPQGL